MLDRLQRRVPGCRGAADAAASPAGGQGRGRVRAGLLGNSGRGNRPAPPAHRRDGRAANRLERALHRDLLAARLLLSAVLLPPAGRDRDRPGLDLQQGRARRTRVRVRDLACRLRSPDRARLRLHPRLGREPFRFGATPTRPLAAGVARSGDRGRPGADPHRRGRRSAPAAVSRQRRRPGVRLPARDRARRPRRRGLRQLLHGWLGGARAAPRRLHARLIEEGARIYGRGPSLLWLGQGFQRQRTGGNVVRACSLLPAVTGNLARPGTGFLYLNGTESRRIDEDYLAGSHLDAGAPDPISHMDLVGALEDPDRSQALFCWNINIAASNPEQGRLHEALRREDLLTVAIDLFPTDTTDLADYVLPAASFLEFDDLVASYFHLTLSAQVKAAEPMGEALPNMEIFRRLSRAMGYTEPELYETDAEVIETVLQRSGIGEDFASLAARGTVPIAAEPVVQFADHRFPTPSGRVELASARAEADGLPRLPLPLADAKPSDGWLRLLSPASPWLLNDSFANDAKIAKRIGAATVALNPDDAAERGLAEGDTAVMANDTGRLRLLVTLSDAVPRGVAYSPKGRWPKREPTRANVNALNPGDRADMGGSTSVHGVEVTVHGGAPAHVRTVARVECVHGREHL